MKYILMTAIESTKRWAAAKAPNASSSASSEKLVSVPPGPAGNDGSCPPQSPALTDELKNILVKRYDVFYFVMATNYMALFGTLGKFFDVGDNDEDPGDQW